MDISREELLQLLEDRPRHERTTLLRSLYNLTQTGLARIAGVARGTVSAWEQKGKQEPGGKAKQRMAVYFKVPPYAFSSDWGEGSLRLPEKKRSDVGLNVPPPAPIKQIN